MRSATDFLPAVISTLTNFATSLLPYFGSGRISRLGISLRRGIASSNLCILGGRVRPPAGPPQGRPASPSVGGERSELGGPFRPPWASWRRISTGLLAVL